MSRPNAQQMQAVIRISGVINGEYSRSIHRCLEVLASPSAHDMARADALAMLRFLGGLIARYCDDYAHAGNCTSACCGSQS